MQVSIDSPNISNKLFDIIHYRKNNNLPAPELLSLGSCGIHILYYAYNIWQERTDWELDKRKNCFSIFKKLPDSPADYFQTNHLHKLQEGRKNGFFAFIIIMCTWSFGKFKNYPQNYWGLGEYEKLFWVASIEEKFSEYNGRFSLRLSTTQSMLHVMLTIINDTEPLLVVFQAERLLSLFVPEKLKEVVSLLHRVA